MEQQLCISSLSSTYKSEKKYALNKPLMKSDLRETINRNRLHENVYNQDLRKKIHLHSKNYADVDVDLRSPISNATDNLNVETCYTYSFPSHGISGHHGQKKSKRIGFGRKEKSTEFLPCVKKRRSPIHEFVRKRDPLHKRSNRKDYKYKKDLKNITERVKTKGCTHESDLFDSQEVTFYCDKNEFSKSNTNLQVTQHSKIEKCSDLPCIDVKKKKKRGSFRSVMRCKRSPSLSLSDSPQPSDKKCHVVDLSEDDPPFKREDNRTKRESSYFSKILHNYDSDTSWEARVNKFVRSLEVGSVSVKPQNAHPSNKLCFPFPPPALTVPTMISHDNSFQNVSSNDIHDHRFDKLDNASCSDSNKDTNVSLYCDIENKKNMEKPYHEVYTRRTHTIQNGKDNVSSSLKDQIKEPLPPGLDEDDDDFELDDMPSTPLVRYIGQRLSSASARGTLVLKFNGIFRYNLLSLLNRGEWIAAKTLKLLGDIGFTEDDLYIQATTSGASVLETELKTAIFTGKLNIGEETSVVQQVLRVVELIVKYYTYTDNEDDDEKFCGNAYEGVESQGRGSTKKLTVGVGHLLKQLSNESKKDKKNMESENSMELPHQPMDNPWRIMADSINGVSLKSFFDLRNYLAKDTLRLEGNRNDAFELAQDMVTCWVMAGYHFSSLRQNIIKYPEDLILPPKDVDKSSYKKYLYYQLLEQLKKLKSQFPSSISEDRLEYLVRKTLMYMVRGIDKSSGSKTAVPKEGVIFNYIPTGLRECSEETRLDPTEDLFSHEASLISSEDPLQSILSTSTSGVRASLELPRRSYMFGTVHLEWVIISGKFHVYEISIYMSDLTTLNVYIVTDVLEKFSDILENLGFVSNPDRHEYYFVQIGIGCVQAVKSSKALHKIANFLEEKRNATDSENKNNGLILLFNSEEELSIFLRLLDQTNQSGLLLNVIKGFSCLDIFLGRNRTKNFAYSGPRLEIHNDDCFYKSETRKDFVSCKHISRSKSEALYQALDFFLDKSITYELFVRPYCFSTFSPTVERLKEHLLKYEELYTLQVYIDAQLRVQNVELFLTGVFQPTLRKDLRDKATIIAGRICQLLVEGGFDRKALRHCFEQNKNFSINSSVFLDKMTNMPQRLKVMDQTMRCINIIKQYFQSPSPEDDA